MDCHLKSSRLMFCLLVNGLTFTNVIHASSDNSDSNGRLPSKVDVEVARAPKQVQFDSSFLSGQAKRVDLTAFEHGNPVLAGTYMVDVYLNGAWQGRRNLQFKGDAQGRVDACVTLPMLIEMGVDSEAVQASMPSSSSDALSCMPLQQRISSAFGVYDSGNLRYDISIPQAFMRREARGYVSPMLWDRGIDAGFIGYSASSTASKSRIAEGQSRSNSYLGLNTGFNFAGWQFRHDSNFTWSDDKDGGSEWQGIATYAQRGLPELEGMLTIGEAFTGGGLFDSIGYRGVNLTTDDRMQPDSLRGYAPVVRGIAQTNARVEVRQNDLLIYSTTVSPGSFIIDDLYATGYGGDLDVSIIEVDGRRSEFKVPFSSVPQMLREGASRYSLTAGQVRGLQVSDEPWLLQGTYQQGVNNQVTMFSGSEMSEGYMSLLFGGALSTPIGAVSMDFTLARTDLGDYGHHTGNSVRLGYSKLLDATETNLTLAAYRYSTEGFYSLRDAVYSRDLESRGINPVGQGRQKSQLQLTLNQSLGDRFGNLYITGSKRDFYNRSGTAKQYQVGYNNALGSVNMGFSVMHTSGYGRSDNQYLLSFSTPLGGGSSPMSMQLDFGAREHGGYENARVGINGSAGENNDLSYGVALSDSQSSGSSVSGNLGYRSRYSALNATYSQTSDYQQVSVGANGSVVLHSGGVTLAPQRGDTMVLVEAPGAENALVSNSSGARVNRDGYAVVPYVSPYRLNTISLDPRGMAHDVELESTSQVVAPYAGAISHLRYETRKGNVLLIQIRNADEYGLPFGAQIKDEQGQLVGMVSQGQRLYVRSEQMQGRLLVEWGNHADQHCYVDYQVPSDADASQRGFIQLEALCR